MSDRVNESAKNKSNKVDAQVKRAPIESAPVENATMGAEPVGALLQRAMVAPGTIRPADGKRLQNALGNQNPAPNARATIQAKLIVGAADDVYEQEADRVADSVMQNASNAAPLDGGISGTAANTPSISRMTADSAQRAGLGAEAGGAFEAGDGLQEQLQRSHGGGEPLPEGLRAKFEPSFGADFGGVRVHTSGNSADMSNAIQAKAFTHGSDIHFNQGAYDPNSSSGQRLLAHELTHVVQQGAASQGPVAQRKEDSNATFAVQRSPFGIIQRTSKRVSSLVAFWEEQKKINAPQVMDRASTGPAPQAPAQQVQGGGGGGDGLPDLGPGSQVNMGGALSFSGGGGGGALHTPSGGGGGALQTPSGGGGGTAGTMSAGAFQNWLAQQGSGSTISSSSSGGGSWISSSSQSAQAPVQSRPQAVQFPGATKYKDRLKVASEYDSEMVDSTVFVFTKVFRVGSEAAFFSSFTPEQRKKNLGDIGWTDEDIADLEARHKTNVQYVTDENDRAEYALNLGPTITQGSATVPYDTKDLFANGVGPGHAIFVMDPNGVFYAGRHKVGVFHHSSFLAGGQAASAGTLKIAGGKLVEITGKSGHYQPKPRQMRLALAELQERGVSLAGVTISYLKTGTFTLGAPEPADAFLAQGITPDLAQASSPASATLSSSSWHPTTSSSGLIGNSTPSGGWPAFSSPSNFQASELWVLDNIARDWQDKLRAMGLTNTKTKWTYGNYVINWSDLVRLLKGEVTIDQITSA